VFGRWRKSKRGESDRADQQQGDPRGGLQSDAYRHADPRDVVEEDGVVMSGPGGTPQEGESVEERRARDFGPGAQSSEREPGGRSDQ
jgi:hypothetical protein